MQEDLDSAKEFTKVDKSAIACLICTASKYFARGADEKSGVYGILSVRVMPCLKKNKLLFIHRPQHHTGEIGLTLFL